MYPHSPHSTCEVRRKQATQVPRAEALLEASGDRIEKMLEMGPGELQRQKESLESHD